MRKLTKSTLIFCCLLSVVFCQTSDNAIMYQQAVNTVDAKKASKLYDKIIDSNEKSDYYWLSILKKAEMKYAIGSYISASSLFKEFNISAPSHLITEDSKELFFKSLSAAGQTDSLKVYQRKLKGSVSSKQTKISSKKKNNWFLQFGAYSKKESASILKESLFEDGFLDVQVSQVLNRGKMIYYVRSSNFKSYAQAEKQALKFKSKDIEFIISGY
mgnify:FL=1|tara:strand:- start:4481 stop:5125 length:645 start_codon:yes stop_codon:yes gene_type:complete